MALALLAHGCASARNYDDPLGPIAVGRAGVPRSADETIRVVSFNIKLARNVTQAIELLSRPGPLRDADILLLQEMDGPATEQVARALEMNYVFIPASVHPTTHRDFGVAVLSRWPLDDPRKIRLPHQDRLYRMRRVAAAATVQLPSGPLRAYSVHLEAPFGMGGQGRRDQARAVAEDAAGWEGPVLVAGDFNGRGGADEIAKHGFLWVTKRVHNTVSFFDFDHVLTRGLCLAHAKATGAAEDATDASDHQPVWALLRPCASPPAR